MVKLEWEGKWSVREFQTGNNGVSLVSLVVIETSNINSSISYF